MITSVTAPPPVIHAGYPMPTTTHTPANYSGVLASVGFTGSVARSTPFVAGNARAGAELRGYFSECLANKIIPIPPSINFGIVAQQTSKTTLLWNTFPGTVTLQSISGMAGIETNAKPLDTIGSMLDVTLAITALLQGSSTIDGTIHLTYDLAPVAIRVLGLRGLIFLYRPFEGYEETDSFSTNVFTAFNGAELRESYLNVGKKGFKYRIMAESHNQFAEIQHKVHAAAKAPIFQPVWSSEAVLTQASGTGTTIYLNTMLTDFQPMDLIVFYQSEASFDVRRVISVGSGQLTIDLATTVSFPAGTLCMPVRACYMQAQIPYAPRYEEMGRYTEFEIGAEEI